MAAHTTQIPSPRLLRLPVVAAELGCSLDTLDRLIRRGQMPVVRMPSGRRRIAREDLDRVIESWRSEAR
jgi:excisionase family DNA binding protein